MLLSNVMDAEMANFLGGKETINKKQEIFSWLLYIMATGPADEAVSEINNQRQLLLWW